MSRLAALLFFLAFFPVSSPAQKIRKEDYLFIDKLVQDAGPMNGSSLQYIVDSITRQCKTELQATRAFYRWAAWYLTFDMRRYRHPRNAPDNASSALMERRAASLGYAQVFKAMCDLKHIECRVVKGVLRWRQKDIGTFDAGAVHYWNVVTINNTHYLIDAASGAGYLDDNGKHFVREYTDAWWLCNRKAFAYSHFPEDKQMQLLEVPITRIEFSMAPIVRPAAIVAGIVPTAAVKGIIRGKEDTATQFRFNIAGKLRVLAINVGYDRGPAVQVPADFDQFGFYITIPHGPAGSHTVEVYIGSNLAYLFRTEIRKSAKKQKRKVR